MYVCGGGGGYPGCRAQVTDILNVHDCGRLINPALAEAQVHGGMSMGLSDMRSQRSCSLMRRQEDRLTITSWIISCLHLWIIRI